MSERIKPRSLQHFRPILRDLFYAAGIIVAVVAVSAHFGSAKPHGAPCSIERSTAND